MTNRKSEPEPKEANRRALHVAVYGHVQGVGFRAWTAAQARKLHITGLVRNCSDSSVEIFAEGNAEDLEKFMELVKNGNSWSRVDRISTSEIRPAGNSRFEIED